MGLPSLFKTSETVLPEILELLKQTRLGTNGAQYRHLDTENRIYQVEHPIFLYIQRQQKVLGNITFSRRIIHGVHHAYYIRYFAFDSAWAGTGTEKEEKGNSLLKSGIESFFEQAFLGTYGNQADLFYAYIEPHNRRSMWMAEQFSFETRAFVLTWSYSRLFPKLHQGFRHLDDSLQTTYLNQLTATYGEMNLFYPFHTQSAQRIVGIVEKGELICACAVHNVNWEILRLPGKNGKQLTKLLPYVPFLRKIINPKSHRFVAVEGVVCQVGQESKIDWLFDSILADTDTHLLLTWQDQQDQMLSNNLKMIPRGWAKYLLPLQTVNLVTKTRTTGCYDPDKPFYISAFDLI
jgi:hypothetical protein